MRAIIAEDPQGIAAELEGWVRQTAQSLRFVGALVLVIRPDGNGIFSTAAFTPDTRLQLGSIMLQLGKELVDDAQKHGAKPGPRKSSGLIGLT